MRIRHRIEMKTKIEHIGRGHGHTVAFSDDTEYELLLSIKVFMIVFDARVFVSVNLKLN